MSYATEFPKAFRPPFGLLAWAEANGWTDDSWGNDVSPSFLSPCGQWKLWTAPRPEHLREVGGPRFALLPAEEECGWPTHATDRWEDMATYLEVLNLP